MKIPNLVLGHNLDDYISVFQKPEVFAKWLQGVKDMEEQMNAKIATVNKVADIDNMLGQARAKLDEANGVRTAAEGAKKEAQIEIAQAREAVKAELDKGRAEIEKIKELLGDRQADVAKRERLASEEMERAQQLVSESESRMTRAEAMLREGAALKARFEEKLAQIGALAT